MTIWEEMFYRSLCVAVAATYVFVAYMLLAVVWMTVDFIQFQWAMR